MKPFDIYIAYVSWRGGGKLRPVLVFKQKGETVRIFLITSRYEEKSETIKAKYLKIIDWAQAGLDKQSYVDTGSIREWPQYVLGKTLKIGQLTEKDKQRLTNFLNMN
jgi:hypothetical protein